MIQAIWDAITGLADWLLGLVKKVFIAVWDLLVDGVCLVLDKVLQFGVDAVAALDVSKLQLGNLWGTLPAEVLNVVGLIGLSDCMLIIGAAILVRLTLQLIPFVRLGS